MPAPLPPDSLAFALWQAAPIIADVINGHSLAEGRLEQVPITIRPAVQDIVYGTLRRYGEGDTLLAPLLSRPPAPLIHALLLAALHRLTTWSDPHTVVNQAVEAAGQFHQGRYRALVNGVLRNYGRQKETLLATLEQQPGARLWHPDWWLARLQADYPDNWSAMVAANNSQPPMALRVNQRRCTRDAYLERLREVGIVGEARGEVGILLAHPEPVDRLPGFREGLVSVQDLGAQRAAELLNPAPGSQVLDACAAPGGKTAHLLERADLALTAVDLDPARCQQVNLGLQRLGLQAEVLCGDSSKPGRWEKQARFDAILADVPCSASGVVRRHPDAKWLRREQDIQRFARNQRQILAQLWPLLQAGGTLLYATCSIFPEENAQQMAQFLVRHPNARQLTEEQWLPQAEHDGFYYSLLQKLA